MADLGVFRSTIARVLFALAFLHGAAARLDLLGSRAGSMADSPCRRRLPAPSGGPQPVEAADERGRDGARGGARRADLAPRVRLHRPPLASGDALLLFRRARHAVG